MADKNTNYGNNGIRRDSMPVANLEAQKTAMANFLWMQYFNNYLLEQGLISEDIRNQYMRHVSCKVLVVLVNFSTHEASIRAPELIDLSQAELVIATVATSKIITFFYKFTQFFCH